MTNGETLRMSGEKTLKPCPFCGGDARYEQDLRLMNAPENTPKWFVVCKQCAVRTPTATIPQVQAIWNNRAKVVPRKEPVLDKIYDEVSHLVFRPYEGRDTLDRKDVLQIIDKYKE